MANTQDCRCAPSSRCGRCDEPDARLDLALEIANRWDCCASVDADRVCLAKKNHADNEHRYEHINQIIPFE
jgi:hypothetical protein